ncbi:hypothetical protein ACHAXT_013138 [Thalassiosira profunda]
MTPTPMRANAARSFVAFIMMSALRRGGGGIAVSAFHHFGASSITRRPHPRCTHRVEISSRLYHASDAVNGGDTTAITDADGEADSALGATSNEGTKQNKTLQNPRSRWALRKHRKKMERLQRDGKLGDTKGDAIENNGLNWESFDFSDSPKMDKRFDDGDDSFSGQTGIPDRVLNTISKDSVTFQSYLQSEANVDDTTSTASLKAQSELLSLSPELVQRSIDVLSPYVQPRRLDRIDEVLGQRTRHSRFLFENPSNPSNVWACLRTLDSFGVQYVDVVVNSESYQGKAAVNQKRGMRTAMGSAVWMTVRQFGSLEAAVRELRDREGCLIYASDLNPDAKDVRDLTWDIDFDEEVSAADGAPNRTGQRPICIVMGNEERGISDEMRELADETFYLPMSGFAESFNLSVATAISLAYMSAASGRCAPGDGSSEGDEYCDITGPLRPGDMDPHELQCLKLKGVLNSLAQKRVGKVLLKKEGIVLPKSILN